MARFGRFALVSLVSLAIASTGLCTALSTGATTCPIVQASAPDHDACCGGEPEDGTCPESNDRPTCRMCDDTVAFLLKEKTDGARITLPLHSTVAHVEARLESAICGQAASLHLSRLSSSPPLHLLNVTFRN